MTDDKNRIWSENKNLCIVNKADSINTIGSVIHTARQSKTNLNPKPNLVHCQTPICQIEQVANCKTICLCNNQKVKNSWLFIFTRISIVWRRWKVEEIGCGFPSGTYGFLVSQQRLASVTNGRFEICTSDDGWLSNWLVRLLLTDGIFFETHL